MMSRTQVTVLLTQSSDVYFEEIAIHQKVVVLFFHEKTIGGGSAGYVGGRESYHVKDVVPMSLESRLKIKLSTV